MWRPGFMSGTEPEQRSALNVGPKARGRLMSWEVESSDPRLPRKVWTAQRPIRPLAPSRPRASIFLVPLGLPASTDMRYARSRMRCSCSPFIAFSCTDHTAEDVQDRALVPKLLDQLAHFGRWSARAERRSRSPHRTRHRPRCGDPAHRFWSCRLTCRLLLCPSFLIRNQGGDAANQYLTRIGLRDKTAVIWDICISDARFQR